MKAPMVSVGNVPAKTVKELNKAISAILSSGAEQKTLRSALAALSKGVTVNVDAIRIDNCQFKTDDSVSNNYPDADTVHNAYPDVTSVTNYNTGFGAVADNDPKREVQS